MTDDDGITLTAEEWSVSVSEKRSTGDYENVEPFASVSGTLPDVDLDDDARRELRARLLSVHKELQAVVERAAENRTRAAGHEDWGVPESDE